jgi:hypothetical protein
MMNETDRLLVAKITGIQVTIKGLMLQVEGWRVHTSSMGDFILHEIEELEKTVVELKSTLQGNGNGPSVKPRTP